MHSTKRLIAVLFVGLAAGVALTTGGAFVYLRSLAGQTMLRNYFADASVAQVPKTGTTASTSVPSLASKTTLLTPKSYTTEGYYKSINALLVALARLETYTIEITPILVKIHQQSLSGDLNGFFDLVVQAKSLIAKEQEQLVLAGQATVALESANYQTPDATTKLLTVTLVSASRELQKKMQDYLSALDRSLSGPVPSASQLANLSNLGKAVEAQSKVFVSVLQALTGHFSPIIKEGTSPAR